MVISDQEVGLPSHQVNGILKLLPLTIRVNLRLDGVAASEFIALLNFPDLTHMDDWACLNGNI